jgi:2'-5' RNA ligase
VKLRLASALLISGSVADEINGLRRACGDALVGRVDPHITLVEPINVREEALDEVQSILRDSAARSARMKFTLGPAASFAPDSPVLYLAVAGDLEELAALRTAVRTGPLAREAVWPFVPHVTIGTDLSDTRLDAGVRALADYRATLTLTHVHLLQEHRDDDEVRRWRPIADAALGGRTVSGRGGVELEVTEAAGSGFTLTARHGGAIAGELRGWVEAGAAHLAWLSVVDAERGLGVGRRLLASCEDLARRRGADRIVATTSGAIAEFLRSRGWRDTPDGLVRDL